MAEITGPQGPGGEAAAFEQGLELGRKYAEHALRRVAAWAEEHPGQLVLAGLMAGFILGKALYPRRRLDLQDLE
ncbi:MAG TPA: hypothetical protein VIR81_12480 [Myxococcales bacterium]